MHAEEMNHVTCHKGGVAIAIANTLMATHFVHWQEAFGLLLAVSLGLLCISSLVVAEPTGRRCPSVSGRSETCVCQSDKGIIDLTSLSKTDGTPRFTGLQDPNDYSYSYNPCQPYKGNYDCSNIHICQTSNFDPTITYDIADAGTEQMWLDTDGTPYAYYTGPGDTTRETKVFLHCDESASVPRATTDGDSGVIFNYIFDIYAKEVCPHGGGGVAPGEIGIVFIFVILPIGFISYFVVGALIMKYHYNATGSNIIPNKGFWMMLPGLIKDGCVFTFGPIIGFLRGKISRGRGYEAPIGSGDQ